MADQNRGNGSRGGVRRPTIKLLALVAVFALSVASLPPSVEAGKHKKPGRWIAAGVRLRLYRLDAPNKVRVLTIDASAKPTVDTVLARNELPGSERVSSMARRTNAVAAINGDYSRPSGRPVFTFARDGRLDQNASTVPETGEQLYGRNFAVDQNKSSVFMTHPKTRSWIWVPAPEGGTSYVVDRMNDRSVQGHAASQIRAFTSVGGAEEKPPHGGCYARLRAKQVPRPVNPTHAPLKRGSSIAPAGIEQKYVVGKRACRYERVSPNGGITLYTPRHGTYADTLRSLSVGSTIVFGWSLGWPEVFDTVGGNPTLIENGAVQKQSIYGTGSFVSGRHPRTAVAYNERTSKLFFVTVDGRRPKYSRGMTLAGLTHFLRSRLGATDALNLDGGGSTTMVVGGKIRGRPSDGEERGVSSALVVLAGQDPGERRAGTSQSVQSSGPVTQGAFGTDSVGGDDFFHDAMAQDPASVGGLAVWLEQQGHELPRFLERTAEEFRATHGPATD
jgi:Phosphodiester glycosidase